MLIRTIEPEDADVLRQLVIELQVAEAHSNPYIVAGELMADDYVRQLFMGDPEVPGQVMVAVDDGQNVVGYVAVQPHVPQEEVHEIAYDYAYVSDIVVREHCRGQGVGRALLIAAENYARRQGASILRLGVLAGNQDARGLYESCGYGEREILLEKRLDES